MQELKRLFADELDPVYHSSRPELGQVIRYIESSPHMLIDYAHHIESENILANLIYSLKSTPNILQIHMYESLQTSIFT